MINSRILALFITIWASMAFSWADGKIDTIRFVTKRADKPRFLTVYTPPGYNSEKSYPLLYLLHGMHGNQYSWENEGHISHLADSLINNGIIRPMVIVTPLCIVNDTMRAYHLPTYLKSGYDFNVHVRRREFEKIFPEIDEYVKQHYSVDRSMIAGLSSGGRQALMLNKKHHFEVVGLFSPVIMQYHVPKRNVGTTYWMRCGAYDMFVLRSLKAHHKLNRKKIPHDFKITRGGHGWNSWRRHIEEFLMCNFPCVEMGKTKSLGGDITAK